MRLAEALGFQHGEMLSLIGAGGKTTTLMHLSKELRDAGSKVLVTTTTRIFKPAKPHVDKLFVVRELEALLAAAANLAAPVIVGAGYDIEDGKLLGLPSDWLDRVAQSRHFDAVLVEADGAASRLFKVPSDLEPVVPSAVGLTVWVLAVKILGKPLDPAWVHRPERAAALSSTAPGAAVTEELIVQLARHPQGCLKGIPSGSRVVALINQADSPEEFQSARRLGEALLTLGLDRVVVNSFASNRPVNEVVSR